MPYSIPRTCPKSRYHKTDFRCARSSIVIILLSHHKPATLRGGVNLFIFEGAKTQANERNIFRGRYIPQMHLITLLCCRADDQLFFLYCTQAKNLQMATLLHSALAGGCTARRGGYGQHGRRQHRPTLYIERRKYVTAARSNLSIHRQSRSMVPEPKLCKGEKIQTTNDTSVAPSTVKYYNFTVPRTRQWTHEKSNMALHG